MHEDVPVQEELAHLESRRNENDSLFVDTYFVTMCTLTCTSARWAGARMTGRNREPRYARH
eukprot:3675535-Prymnesium_polylepis.1